MSAHSSRSLTNTPSVSATSLAAAGTPEASSKTIGGAFDLTANVVRRAVNALKRKAIIRLGLVSDQKFYLDSAIVKPRGDVERIALHSDSVDLEFTLPADGSKARNSYRPRFVYGIADATVDAISNLVYDGKGQFIAESSSWLAMRQLYSWPSPQIRRPRAELRGEYVFLPTNGYYHWLVEDLPVFLKSLYLAPKAKVLLPSNAASYVREVAELLSNEVVEISGPARVERLVMTAKTGGVGSPFGGLTPHPADVVILRDFFAKFLSGHPGNRKLYLTRVGQKRSPVNERVLQSRMGRQGFETFDGSRMSLTSQIELFSSATQLVGMHGAALANIVWAPLGINVTEIFSSVYMPACYSALTSIARGTYGCLAHMPGTNDAIDEDTIDRLTRPSLPPQQIIGSVGSR